MPIYPKMHILICVLEQRFFAFEFFKSSIKKFALVQNPKDKYIAICILFLEMWIRSSHIRMPRNQIPPASLLPDKHGWVQVRDNSLCVECCYHGIEKYKCSGILLAGVRDPLWTGDRAHTQEPFARWLNALFLGKILLNYQCRDVAEAEPWLGSQRGHTQLQQRWGEQFKHFPSENHPTPQLLFATMTKPTRGK